MKRAWPRAHQSTVASEPPRAAGTGLASLQVCTDQGVLFGGLIVERKRGIPGEEGSLRGEVPLPSCAPLRSIKHLRLNHAAHKNIIIRHIREPIDERLRPLVEKPDAGVAVEEDLTFPWDGEVPIWIAAPHVPTILRQKRTLRLLAPGCYRVEPAAFSFLWIAANELPLTDELIPFLIVRSGQALDEFGHWVKTRRPPAWLLRMIEFLPMSTAIHDELFRFVMSKTDDPAIRARQLRMARMYVDMTPEVRDELVEEGQLEEARSALRRVLARRKLALGAEAEARIAACTDLATLERWHDQAVDALSAADALQ